MVFWITKRGMGTQAIIIDDEDWPRVKEYTWRIRRERPTGDLRVFTRLSTREIRLDQFILKIEKMPRLADIIRKDDNLLDFRKENLLYIGPPLEQWNKNKTRKRSKENAV